MIRADTEDCAGMGYRFLKDEAIMFAVKGESHFLVGIKNMVFSPIARVFLFPQTELSGG